MGYWIGDVYLPDAGEAPEQSNWMLHQAGESFSGVPTATTPTPSTGPDSSTWEFYGNSPMRASMQLAKALGLTPAQYNERLASSGLGKMTNPYPTDRSMWDILSGEFGISANPQIQAMRAQYEPYWQSSGDSWADAWHASNKGPSVGDVVKGALFAIGTPLTLGTALTGIPAATALGGGLGADIIGAITNPAGSLGLSGIPASIVNTGIKQGLGSLLDTDGSRQVRVQTPSVADSSAAGATNAQPEAVSSLAQDVVSPSTSLSAPQSLSSQVMSITKPRKPQIRLTEGFRRGQ